MILSSLAAAVVVGGGTWLVRRLGRPPPDEHRPVTAVGRASSVPPERAPSPGEERDVAVRHNLGVAGGSLALLAVGPVVGPVAVAPGMGLLMYFTGRHLRFAWRQFRDDGKVGSPVLDATALVGSLALGYWTLAAGIGAVTASADWLARRTERRSQVDLASLFGARSSNAWVRRGATVVEVPCAELRAGDVIVVEAGMTLPVDGQVVAGLGRVDQQSLTGESQPVDLGPGDAALAATILLEGRLDIAVARDGRDSLAAELVTLLGEVDQARDDGITRAQRTIDRWVPTTLAAAGLGVVVGGPVTGVAVVFSGIGYALRYAGPTALLNHMRLAMGRGVLVRDGRTLERLDEVDTVVFDKTGTLTHAVPRLYRVEAVGGHDADEVLRLAAAAEAHQVHPIAQAIRRAAGEVSVGTAHVTVRPGLGLAVEVDGARVLVGSARLMAAESVVLADIAPAADDVIVVHVGLDGQHAGSLYLEAAVRDEAADVIADLHARGIDVMLLSGDRKPVTRALADRLDIERVFAEVMPQQKAQIIEELQAEGRTVCFVGDGINDALALRTADVSISFADAAPIAESAAEVVLMTPDLHLVGAVLALADDNTRNFRRSAAISTASGVLCIGGVLVLGMGLGPAMMLYNAGVAASMVNATAPLVVDAVSSTSSVSPEEAA